MLSPVPAASRAAADDARWRFLLEGALPTVGGRVEEAGVRGPALALLPAAGTIGAAVTTDNPSRMALSMAPSVAVARALSSTVQKLARVRNA